jgi:predicted nucleic acid-binding protein
MLATVMANNLELPDALIAQSALKGGCESVLTFDKKATRSDGFELMAMTAS